MCLVRNYARKQKKRARARESENTGCEQRQMLMPSIAKKKLPLKSIKRRNNNNESSRWKGLLTIVVSLSYIKLRSKRNSHTSLHDWKNEEGEQTFFLFCLFFFVNIEIDIYIYIHDRSKKQINKQGDEETKTSDLFHSSRAEFISCPLSVELEVGHWALEVASTADHYSDHRTDIWLSSHLASKSERRTSHCLRWSAERETRSLTWKEHISDSSTDIIPPALSNSPQ